MALASKSSFQLTALALALASIGAAQAATINWATDTSGNWSVPGNWSPAQLPDSASDVVITSVTGLKTITHDTGADIINSLTTNASAVVTVTNSSSLQVNNGGTNGGTFRADNGTFTFNTGALNNNGTINAINNGRVVFQNGAALRGGTVSTGSGGQVVLTSSAVLDGLTNGPITNTGAIVEADGATVFALGTINNSGSITVGASADMRIQGSNTLALNGTGNLTLASSGSRLFGDASSAVLAIGAGQTVQGTGQIGLSSLFVTNAGLITANVSGQTLQLDPSDGDSTNAGLVNTGTMRAENGGNLNLLGGVYNNQAGTITAVGTGSTVTTGGTATIEGGTISATAGGLVSISNSSLLDGATHGPLTLSGNVRIADGAVAFVAGTVNDGSLTIGASSDLRIQGANNLTLQNGTTTLSTVGTRLFGDNGNDLLTNAAGNTIQGAGQVGINQTLIRNSGLITANVSGQTLQIDPSDGDATSAGLVNLSTMRAENGGNLNLLGGFYNNQAGTIAATGSGSTVTSGAAATIQGGLISATSGGSVILSGSTFIDGASHGATTLTGNVSVADGAVVFIAGTVNDNTLSIGASADLRIQGTNNLTLQGGTTTMATNGTRLFGDNGNDILTNAANNTIQGSGQIGINQTLITNAGLITSNVAGGTITLDPSDGNSATPGFINTGTLRAENGGALTLIGGFYDNSAGAIRVLNGSTATLTAGSVVQGGLIATAGTGVVTLTGSTFIDGVTRGATTLSGNIVESDGAVVFGAGTINDGTLTIGVSADLRIAGTNNLTLQNGTTTLATEGTRIFGENGNDILTNAASNTIQGRGQIGANQAFVTNAGLITSNVSGGAMTLDPTDGDGINAGLINTGTLRAENGGTLNFAAGHFNNQGGTIAALNGSTVNMTTNSVIEGGTLTSTGTGVFNLSGSLTLDGTAHGALTNNANAVVASGGVIFATGSIINNGTIANSASSDIRILGATDLALSGTGSITMASGSRIFGDNGNDTLTNGASHTIQGQGNIGANQMNLTNAGTINANVSGATLTVDVIDAVGVVNQTSGVLMASNGGTLNIVDATTGTGTIRTDSGGTVQINVASTTGKLINNANLALGTNNLTVSNDYSNANFGTGNNFNKRAGVTGTGQILASGDVAQAITGTNVTNGTSGAPTLTIGNVRVGGTTFNYQVANTGTNGPAIRGGIEPGANGGNITDARLSGSGVTSSNYGPVAAGSASGNLGVTFTATTAGALAPLSGQSVHIGNNFDNLSEQTMGIVLANGAAAFNAASGSATTLALGNTRVNGTLAGHIGVSNTAPAGSFSEDLNAAIGSSSGVTASGSITGLVAGQSNASAIAASLATNTAGAKSGSVTLNYQTNGTVNGVSNGLGVASVGSQTVAVTGNVFQTAQGNIVTAPLNFGTVQVGQTVSQTLSIQNIATGPTGFVEDLNAAFGSTTGTGSNLISGTGSINALVAGASSSAMTVNVNTTAAGTVNGSIAVNYQTNGTVNGVSNGLGVASAGSQNFGVNGSIQTTANVVNQASPVINTPTVALGNVRIGSTSPSGAVSVTNQATTAPQAALDASIAGNGSITAAGSFNLLTPGLTNTSSLTVGMDTTQAGSKNGTATISFISDAANIGNCAPNCQLNLASQNVNVTGAVYRLANGQASTTPITVAARVGDAVSSTAIGITNSSPDQFTEGLTVSRGATSAGFTSAGSITNLGAGSSSNAISVALNTSTAGTFTGTQALNYISTGAGTDNAADIAAGSQTVALNGKVYTTAVSQPNTTTVNFGTVHVGDTITAQGVSVTNAAPVTALNDVLVASAAGATGPFTASGNLGAGLAAGQTSANGLKVGLNTNNAGVFNGSATFNAASHDGDLSDAALSNIAVNLIGTVNNFASESFSFAGGSGTLTRNGSVWTLDFGTVAQGSGTETATLTAGNSAAGPADLLDGVFQFLDAEDFSESGFSNFANLAAGQNTGPLTFAFDTATLGDFMDTITLAGVGHNDSGFSQSIGDIQLIVRGIVADVGGGPGNGVPEPDSLVLIGLGLPLLFLRRGRKARQQVVAG